MSEHMTSDYSDAGDTFATRPSNAGDEDHDAVSCGKTDCHKDIASRDFILKRFLPAAQAMTTTDRKSSAPTSSLPPDQHRYCVIPCLSFFSLPVSICVFVMFINLLCSSTLDFYS